jgi:hypothetical protein
MFGPAYFAATLMAFVACSFLYILVRSWRRMRISNRLVLFALVCALVCSASRLVFVQFSNQQLAGLASLGFVQGNHYYLGNHGVFHEVSGSTYHSNLLFDRLTSISTGVFTAVLALGLLLKGSFRPRLYSGYPTGTPQ